jgi:hypothetical protein
MHIVVDLYSTDFSTLVALEGCYKVVDFSSYWDTWSGL